MRLSAAIRIGSMTTRQIKGWISDGRNGRCALGAAAEAANLPGLSAMCCDSRMVYNAFPVAFNKVLHPTEGIYCTLGYIICHLNDLKGWTREQIADWVEKIENEMEEKDNGTSNKSITAREDAHSTVRA